MSAEGTDFEQLESRFANHLARITPEGPLVVGVSGGGDSVALLLLLTSTPRRVIVAHVDHALRPESEADAAWVQALAERLGYPFESERFRVAQIVQEKGGNLEATAREIRYNFFARVAKKHRAQAILTAHTQDDQAETVLLQMVQGTGRALGMRPKRGKVIRPLLETSHGVLRAYLKAKDQTWLEDLSNADTSLDRNFLRHEVLPKLRGRFPQSSFSFARFAAITQLDDDALDPLAANLLLRDRRWPCPAYRVAPLVHAPSALRRRALRQVLEEIGLRPEARLILSLERVLTEEAVTLPESWIARRRDGTLFLIPPDLELPAWRDSRLPQPGDYLDITGGRKRFVEFMAERGVPSELKLAWPLRALGSEVREVWNLWPEPLDSHFMRIALEEAEQAGRKGEVPIGALIAWDGKVLARAHNQVEQNGFSTAHAEFLALTQAMQKRGEKVLPAATVYVTLEPCPMCFGALLEAQVRRVVYAVENLKAGAVTVHGLKPPFAWEGGWQEREASRLLKEFFATKRDKLSSLEK